MVLQMSTFNPKVFVEKIKINLKMLKLDVAQVNSSTKVTI